MNRFQNKTVIVTGGAKGIGKCIAESFRKEGADVCVFDLLENDGFQGDLGKKVDIEKFVQTVLLKHDCVDVIVNNAKPIFKGIDECTYEEFQYALNVGVAGAFWMVKLLKDHLSKDASIINISSTRDSQSMPQSESYAAAKGGIRALTHALAVSLSGKARVNSISPGWIETEDAVYEGADALQQPVGRVGNVNDIASLVLFLASEEAGFITGENIAVDGGMSKLMIYHGEHGWNLDVE